MSAFSSRVRNLYKQLLFAGKDYPGGLEIVRRKTKPQFMKLRDEIDPKKIEEAIKRGEYILGELQALNAFHKYRTLKKRYDGSMNEDIGEFIGGEIRKIEEELEK